MCLDVFSQDITVVLDRKSSKVTLLLVRLMLFPAQDFVARKRKFFTEGVDDVFVSDAGSSDHQ